MTCFWSLDINLRSRLTIHTRDTSGAVDENEDHATEGPSDTEDSNSTAVNTTSCTIGLNLITDDCQNGDV